jgi:hypothetical protein
MQLRAVILLAIGLLAPAGCTRAGTIWVGPPSPPAVVSPDPSPTPGPPPTVPETCTQVRQTTRALGSDVPRKFRDTGATGTQLLDMIRAVYQLAESSLAGYRKKTADTRLAAAIRAIEVRYADIRARLKKPDDVDRVNYQPKELTAALATLDKVCGS